MSMSTKVQEFKPSGLGLSTNVPVFNPTASAAFVPKVPVHTFAGGINTSMSTSASTFTPAFSKPAEAPKEKEKPKEKHVLMIERIVRGSDTDEKGIKLTPEDSEKASKMLDVINKVKTEKTIRVDLLKTFLEQMKELTKKPENLVKMSVHGRIINRADQGEHRSLVDKKEGGRLNRPNGEYN